MPEYPWIIYRMSEGPLTTKEVHQGVNEQLNRKLGTDWGYSEYEWANLLQGFRPLPIRTASGTIAHFSDGADSVPMKSVVANITPIQDLHGYSKPWAAGAGSNKWDEQWELGGFNSVGEPIPADDRIRSVNFTPIQPNTSYYFKTTNTLGVRYYDANKNFISSANGTNTALTIPSNAYYLKVLILNTTTYGNDVAINYPSTVTTYSPYANVCPISGTSVLNVKHEGKNLLNGDSYYSSYKQEDGSYIASGNVFISIRLPILSSWVGKEMTLSAYIRKTEGSNITNVRVRAYINGSSRDGNYVNSEDYTLSKITFTPVSTSDFFGITYGSNGGGNAQIKDIQLEIGSTSSTYEPYKSETYTFDLGQEIMGGTADVVGGTGSKTKEKITVNGSEAWQVIASGANKRYTLTLNGYTPNNAEISDIFQYLPTTTGNFGTFYFAQGILRIPDGNDTFATLADFKQWLSENTPSFLLQRTTPTPFTFTGQPINSYLGVNNVWTDSGEVLDVEYRSNF